MWGRPQEHAAKQTPMLPQAVRKMVKSWIGTLAVLAFCQAAGALRVSKTVRALCI